ncbi:AgmX/PglI C-terminal domain-containing protein [candidate division KSB1 bacterium]|nr:AgmX/PglI C-terminal domain-containing protein [candidate division KSB1 bacterium]
MESKKYYRSIKHKVGTERLKNETVSPQIPDENQKTARRQFLLQDLQGMYIPQFPERLKRGFWRNLDVRFYKILLASFIFNISLLILLFHNTSFEESTENIAKIQSRYVDLILQQSKKDGLEPFPDEKAKQPVRSRPLPEAETRDEGRSGRSRSRDTQETRIMDKETFLEERETSRQERRGQSSQLSSRISSVGILEYIKNRVITSQVDAEFLTQADQANQNFTQVLGGVEASQLFASGENYGSGSYGAGGTGPERGSGISNIIRQPKTRRVNPRTQAQDLFGDEVPIQEMKSTAIEKKANFEKTPPVSDELSGLQKKRANRTANELSKTIQSHNKAIQDCYKTALKRNSSLSGKVTIRISINPEGQVVNTEVVASTIHDPEMEQCLLHRINRWNDFGVCVTQRGIFAFKQVFSFGN